LIENEREGIIQALGVCLSNTKIAVFGGSKTIVSPLIVDSGAFCEVVF